MTVIEKIDSLYANNVPKGLAKNGAKNARPCITGCYNGPCEKNRNRFSTDFTIFA
jgi:hypothetical protein